MQQTTLKYHLLTAILRRLKAEKLGIGQHIQLQHLIAELPEDISLEQFKMILGPVIAKNEQEQEQFYKLFDDALEEVRLVAAAREEIPQAETIASQAVRKERRDRSLIALIGLLVLGGILTIWLIENFQ